MNGPNAYKTFNLWLVFIGLLLFGLFVTWRYGLFNTLISTDPSGLSVIILIFFAIATLHVGLLARRIGTETALNDELGKLARNNEPLFRVEKNTSVRLSVENIQDSLAQEHLLFLAEKTLAYGQISNQDLLLDRLENRVRRGHETGWFIADLMIRLGLLGTVIGFIFMLGSIATVTSVDLQALQQLLGTMSEGMRIALYTTLSGLSAGILLSFQYQLLEQGADRLLSDIIELSEVHAVSQLISLLEDKPA